MARGRKGLLSRLTGPIREVASRVFSKVEDDPQALDQEAEEFFARVERAPPQAASASAENGRLTEDDFRMAMEDLLKEDEGRFQTKLHVISLVEFREAVGPRWGRVREKVMMIAEGVINAHIGAGNVFGRQGTDAFVLLFRGGTPAAEARRRAVAIAQELGVRLVGDQYDAQRPLALAAELDLADALGEDGGLNADAIGKAVGQVRAIVAKQAEPARPAGDAPPLHTAHREKEQALSAITGGAEAAPSQRQAARLVRDESGGFGERPGGVLVAEAERTAKDPTAAWYFFDGEGGGGKVTTPDPMDQPPPLPAGAKLAVAWRPSWLAQGEVMGGFLARVQRLDTSEAPAMESSHAYAPDDIAGAQAMDRFVMAQAVRALRTGAEQGMGTLILPIHWLSAAGVNRTEVLAPLADLSEDIRKTKVMLELFGLPEHLTQGELGFVVKALKPFAGQLLLRVPLHDTRVTMAAACGVDGIGIDLAELVPTQRTDDEHLLDALARFQKAALRSHLAAHLWGARRRTVVTGAVGGGFAMVNGPALMKDIPRPAKPLPAPKARLLGPKA